MDLHPGPEKSRSPESKAAELEPMRRALRENQDWFQDLVEHSQDLMCIHDLQGRLLSVNPAPARVLGYSVEELLQIPMRDILAPEYRPHFEAYLREIEGDGESHGTMAVLTRSGERRIWEYHNALRTEGVASPIVRGIAHDVTEQKRAEERLREVGESLLDKVRENERTIRDLKLFRALLDQCNDAVEVVDPETLRFLDVNQKTCSDLGYSREELLSMRVSDINPAAGEFASANITEMIRKSGRLVLERAHRRKDGTIFPVEVSLRWVRLERDYVVVVARDLTERKRTEERLREVSQSLLDKVRENERTIRDLKLFRTLVDSSNDAIEVVDPETLRFIDGNEKAYTSLGYTREEFLSLRVFDTDPAVTESSIVPIREQWRNLGRLVLESVHRRKDGSTFPVEVSTKQVHADRDYVIAIVRDLTERKRVETRLREYERVVEGIEEMFVVVDRDYRYVIANRAFLNYRGIKKEQVVGRLLSEVLNKEAFETIIKPKVDECFQGKVVQYEMQYSYPKLGKRNLLISYFPIDGPAGVDRIAAVMRDITQRKRAEEALRRSEDSYRNFVSQSSEGIFRQDTDAPVAIDLPEDEIVHHILYDSYVAECNDALAAMYGMTSADELRGRRLTEMVVAQDPHNIEVAREFVRNGFRLLDRETHEVDVHGNPKVILNSMIGTVEDGKLVRIWGIQRDITEKVKLEESRRRAEEALRQNVAQLQAVTEELRLAKEKLSEEKLYLEQAIDTELGFGEIIGRSSALNEVMQKVAKVAPSDATVLLLGETGTGKELVARAIHRMSPREGNSFIKLNCAAIPSGLLESELFGHEKGAFTGAVARKLGRLELADRGTLFLDEIGEIPLGLQPKLLRVLQDMEFERLGGTQTLKVNFRLLAATNRDLLKSVKAREFRSDLYYRLNVFPILIPPLRERREDIRPLVEHFVRKFAMQMKKSITSIPSKTMEMLVRWDWPGNIRELENFLERSVILTSGSVLQSPLSELNAPGDQGGSRPSGSLHDKDRERILRVLRECRGKLGGPDGAAARLGLKRTTLQSRLDQLGIKPGAYRA